MKANTTRALVLAAMLALAGCLGGDTPEDQLKSIEEKQAKNLPMTDEQKSGIEASISRGREALAAGDKEAASKAFAEALTVLQKAEDAALYNKAD